MFLEAVARRLPDVIAYRMAGSDDEHLKQPELLEIFADSRATVLITSCNVLETLDEHSLPATIEHGHLADGQAGLSPACAGEQHSIERIAVR